MSTQRLSEIIADAAKCLSQENTIETEFEEELLSWDNSADLPEEMYRAAREVLEHIFALYAEFPGDSGERSRNYPTGIK